MTNYLIHITQATDFTLAIEAESEEQARELFEEASAGDFDFLESNVEIHSVVALEN
jgi:hypothetical protein